MFAYSVIAANTAQAYPRSIQRNFFVFAESIESAIVLATSAVDKLREAMIRHKVNPKDFKVVKVEQEAEVIESVGFLSGANGEDWAKFVAMEIAKDAAD